MLPKKHLCVCVPSRFSYFQLSANPWTVAHKVPLFMGFSRQESWSRMPCPPPRYPPDPGIESMSLMFSALAGVFYTTSTTWKAQEITSMAQKKKKKKRPGTLSVEGSKFVPAGSSLWTLSSAYVS